jgi:hypothetical protein
MTSKPPRQIAPVSLNRGPWAYPPGEPQWAPSRQGSVAATNRPRTLETLLPQRFLASHFLTPLPPKPLAALLLRPLRRLGWRPPGPRPPLSGSLRPGLVPSWCLSPSLPPIHHRGERETEGKTGQRHPRTAPGPAAQRPHQERENGNGAERPAHSTPPENGGGAAKGSGPRGRTLGEGPSAVGWQCHCCLRGPVSPLRDEGVPQVSQVMLTERVFPIGSR